MLRRMKINYFSTTAKIISRFGNAWLIRRADGKHELAGGSDGDYTAAKEWVSLFAHDIAFSRPDLLWHSTRLNSRQCVADIPPLAIWK